MALPPSTSCVLSMFVAHAQDTVAVSPSPADCRSTGSQLPRRSLCLFGYPAVCSTAVFCASSRSFGPIGGLML